MAALNGNQISQLVDVPHGIPFDVVDVIKTPQATLDYYKIVSRDGEDSYHIWSPKQHQVEFERDYDFWKTHLIKHTEVVIRETGGKKKVSWAEYKPSK